MPGNIGITEIAIVLVIVLIIFGPKRLPELGRSLGHGIREFKGSISGENNDDDVAKPELDKSTPAATPTATVVEESEDADAEPSKTSTGS